MFSTFSKISTIVILLLFTTKIRSQSSVAADLSKPYEISLGGEWNFSTDPSSLGEKQKWYAVGWNDKAWEKLQAGKGWVEQGIHHSGFGWYRKTITLPAEYEGIPMIISLAKIPYDDDVWVNGVRVGGLSGAYKFRNLIPRVYTVPPSLLRYGSDNQITIRTWGLDGVGVEGKDFGLIGGAYTAVLDPLQTGFRKKGGAVEQTVDHFDLAMAQQGMPFEMIVRFPATAFPGLSGNIMYTIADFYNNKIDSGNIKIMQDARKGIVHALLPISEQTSQSIYFSGRFKLLLQGSDNNGNRLFEEQREFDHLSFAGRDEKILPVLTHSSPEETPYGNLKLIDEIDCSIPSAEDPHPYMQSGFDGKQLHSTPGPHVNVTVTDILGKKARESGYGWFAYRLGRGQLKPHTTYLVRIEYPEDKPRYCPVEIQTGENFMDIGWKNGASPDNPYDNWPLTNQWQWYDAIVPLDDETAGMSGASGASSRNGFWIYFMNKINYPVSFPQYKGGPAIARIKLYEIDANKNAPVITKPASLPERILMVDWERQPLQQPMDIARYAKLMGYNAVSPVVIKWAFMNFTDPFKGYLSYNVDERDNWLFKPDVQGQLQTAIPGKPSVHANYLDATKKYGLHYIPRIEYGGSAELPAEARAIGADGKLAKPNRFADWSGDLLHPKTLEDLKPLLDHLFVPYLKNNPQLSGVLWRIRSERMPISYSEWDVKLFARETGTSVPLLAADSLAKWISSGPLREAYETWWHTKRKDFHEKIAQQLQSYRPDLKLYYYNWDDDKFSLGAMDLTRWGFLGEVQKAARSGDDSAIAVYMDHFKKRAAYTAKDFIAMMHSGNILETQTAPIPHNGLRPSLYKNSKGIEVFAPANYLYLANKPDYLNYFKTKEGVAVSNVVPYDEQNSRSINPRYEGQMMTAGGPDFSMALELLSYFHTDARTITYTSYTYGRGFAAEHRRFAQAFLALPAIEGEVIPSDDEEVKIRVYPAAEGLYAGIASRSYTAKEIRLVIPGKYLPGKKNIVVKDLVTGQLLPSTNKDDKWIIKVKSRAMQLNALFIQ